MDPLLLIALILFILWLAGAFVVPVGGSLVHVLVVLALILIVIRLLR
jgi:hypothetical protein